MRQRYFYYVLITGLGMLLSNCSGNKPKEKKVEVKPMSEIIDESISRAIPKYKELGSEMEGTPDMLPRTIDKNGKLITSNSAWWTSGFFPGTLWYLYEYSKDEEILRLAEEMTNRVEDQQYTTDNHDVGFMIYCSFGNGLRISNKENYIDVIMNGAKSLSTRFDDHIGLIQSWGANEKWQYPVIIDNMMNLELLNWASRNSGDSSFVQISITHADNTIKNHYREDNSCFHVISYDTVTAEIEARNTHQGFADESAWARGQSWGLYGYVMMYRDTRFDRYLNHAVQIAEFIINHPNFPDDKVPFWDFDAPNEERDASAAAIMASALVELSQYVDEEVSSRLFGSC